jgi:hypothetical protein
MFSWSLPLHSAIANARRSTQKIKAMADVRPLGIDDTDAIIRSYYREIPT